MQVVYDERIAAPNCDPERWAPGTEERIAADFVRYVYERSGHAARKAIEIIVKVLFRT